jgi:hypothetical protein
MQRTTSLRGPLHTNPILHRPSQGVQKGDGVSNPTSKRRSPTIRPYIYQCCTRSSVLLPPDTDRSIKPPPTISLNAKTHVDMYIRFSHVSARSCKLCPLVPPITTKSLCSHRALNQDLRFHVSIYYNALSNQMSNRSLVPRLLFSSVCTLHDCLHHDRT